jgi:hypothetical protein
LRSGLRAGALPAAAADGVTAKAGERAMRYLVAYDIEDDRARTRIADVMERFGVRVQSPPSSAASRAGWAFS